MNDQVLLRRLSEWVVLMNKSARPIPGHHRHWGTGDCSVACNEDCLYAAARAVTLRPPLDPDVEAHLVEYIKWILGEREDTPRLAITPAQEQEGWRTLLKVLLPS